VVKHFSEAQWADFARNVISGTEKMNMQQHIQGGCQKCEETLEVWRNVLAIAERESGFTPSGDMVRVVKSQFAAVVARASRGFRVLFDSALQPITAGIRGSVSARQFLYETDDYYIDLRVEPRREADRACLVGQILTRKGLDRGAAGVSVRIKKGNQSLAETMANRFGEFQLEFDGSSDLHISIAGNEGNEIVLPLHGIHGKSLEPKGLD
jgi:hypothetical protein